MTHLEAVIEFTALVARDPGAKTLGPAQILGTVRGLMRNATTLQRLAVDQCNRTWTAADERSRAGARKRADEIAATIGAACEHANDPRGAVLQLKLRGRANNSFGGRNAGNEDARVCVPVRA